MSDTVQVLLQYGYVVLFAFVLAEQIGLPIPAVPVQLGIGALAGAGRMSPALALGVALAASLPPDVVWYELGRRNYALVVLGAALATYVVIKFVQRRRFLRSLRMARITADELKRRLDARDGGWTAGSRSRRSRSSHAPRGRARSVQSLS